jgi:hypothetical protein
MWHVDARTNKSPSQSRSEGRQKKAQPAAAGWVSENKNPFRSAEGSRAASGANEAHKQNQIRFHPRNPRLLLFLKLTTDNFPKTGTSPHFFSDFC